MYKKFLSICLLLLFNKFFYTQRDSNKIIDISDFYSSANHWYNIEDEIRAITPIDKQKSYQPTQIKEIADNILLYQKTNGGWPKNYDMLAILTQEQKDSLANFRKILNSTFDNGATYSQINYLAEAYSTLKDEKYKDACLRGIDFVLSAQYPNGGFPQFYPDTSGYRKYITFNDDAMIGVINLLENIYSNNSLYTFIDESRFEKIRLALKKGIECILNCQIKEKDTLYVWCQQHDHITLLPQWARTFEPPAICNMESVVILKFLMKIEFPDERIINAIQSAVRWFNKSKLLGYRYENVKSESEKFIFHTANYDRILVEDPDAPPIWPRFNELKTHKPVFCNRDGKCVYNLMEVDKERRTGYAWYTKDPQQILDAYSEWQKKIVAPKFPKGTLGN